MFFREMKPAVLEHLQHWSVLGQNLRDQLIEPRPTSNRSKMAHQCGADPLPLMLVEDGKSHLGCPRLSDNVIPTRADHHALAQSRRPMDMMIQGWSMRRFHAEDAQREEGAPEILTSSWS